MKLLIAILTISLTSPIWSQTDSIKVKIKKIDGYKVIMKTLERPRVKLFTFCKPPFKEKEKVWIRKP